MGLFCVGWICGVKESLVELWKVAPEVIMLWPWVPHMCVYLQKCYHNSVFITQKHQKLVFSFVNSLLRNVRIKWWKQYLKTYLNRLHLHGSHHFWVMSNGNWVMSDGNTKIQTASNIAWSNLMSLVSLFYFINYATIL